MHKSKILFYKIKYFIFDRLLELRMNRYIKDKKIAKFLDKILIFMENQTTRDIEYTLIYIRILRAVFFLQ